MLDFAALDELAFQYEGYEDAFYEKENEFRPNNTHSNKEVVDPTVVVTKATNPITAEHMDYVPMLPSYPNTLPNGYGYVVDLRATEQLDDDVNQRAKDVDVRYKRRCD